MKELIEKSSSLIIGAFIVLLVSLSWIFVNQGKAMISNAGKSIQRQNAYLAASPLKPFSNRVVSGDTVISCIYSLENGDPLRLKVVVRNKDDGNGRGFAWIHDADGVQRYYPYNKDNEQNYIKPGGKYRGIINKNANGIEEEIVFTEQ